MSEAVKINNGHYFEIGDRCHTTMENMESNLTKHPALTDEQRQKLEKAQSLIMEVYQWAWQQYDDEV